MDQRIIKIATEVVAKASREKPADGVLQTVLRSERGLTPTLSRVASRTVFDYYRWRGWIDPEWPLPKQLAQTETLAGQFTKSSESFSEDELRAKAVPGWIWEQLEAPPGWTKSLQSDPKLWLRARVGRGSTLAKQLGDCIPAGQGTLSDCLNYAGPKDLFRLPEFHAGSFEIQDLSSQLASLLCNPQPGETWWDACAGEGGKMLHLSDLMGNKGLILASDRTLWRLQKLKRRAARAQVFNYRVVNWSGEPKLPVRTRFDGVLVDAPCTGVGTWHRNPHARWTANLDDVHELAAIQTQLLCNAAPSVKPGGKLVYAVCTLTLAETVAVAKSVEQLLPDFDPLPAKNPLLPGDPPKAQHWFWPQDRGGNGMFIALWVKKC